MFLFLFSIFGLILNYKLSRTFIRFQVVQEEKFHFIFILLNLPEFLFLIFKELNLLFFIYIGIILLTLTFFSIFFENYLKKIFFEKQIQVIDQLILQVKTGISPQKSAHNVFNSLKSFQKLVFEPLTQLNSKTEVTIFARYKFTEDYFKELQTIVSSQVKLFDQLQFFRKNLKIKHDLIKKSNVATVQVRAQALMAVFIYLFLFIFSVYQLDLLSFIKTIFTSVMLMTLGLFYILFKGVKVKWKI